ncbi:outer membrane beta-barrel protein [Sphingobacterium sp. Mn56C]|uniref:outer membrane beta-barrel protein n=1 Tax=Sphingobacterium sp. Mn56C TaxID=3395261 RepID=UPI003BE2C3AA
MRLILVFLIIPFVIQAQQLKLKGTVSDAAETPISQATIIISDTLNHPVTQTYSLEDGRFEINLPAASNYILSVQHLNYQRYERYLSTESLTQPVHIQLAAHSNSLDEVSVSATKPQIVRKVDRIEFRVEHSNISALNSWEILKRTPSVNIIGSTISVQGNSQIIFMINDKRVLMNVEDLKTLLESTPGSELQSIEVITTAPAKYEAQGSILINIKMRQNQQSGYRGTVIGLYEQSNYGKQLLAFTNYYKTKKVNLRATYTRARGTYARYGEDMVFYQNDQTTWKSDLVRVDRNNNQNSYVVSADITPDSLWTVSMGINGSFYPRSTGLYQVPTEIFNAANEIESRYFTSNDHADSHANHNVYLQVSKVLHKKSSIDWINYFTTNRRKKFQDVQTVLDFKGQMPRLVYFIADNSSNTKLFSTQLDYTLKGASQLLEAGAKYSFIRSGSALLFSDNEEGDLYFRPEKSSDFTYNEHNIAAYVSASYDWKNWSFKGGLRGEYTQQDGIVSLPLLRNSTRYFVWFPTFYAQYKGAKNAQWSMAYGKRINRPAYAWLNPAKSYFNLFSYFQGDPQLRATISHKVTLGYNRNNWNIEAFYSYDKWPNMEISYQDNTRKQVIYQYTNIDEDQSSGLEVSKMLQLKPYWTINLSATGLYQQNYFMGVDSKRYKNDAFQFYSSGSSSFILSHKTNWNLELGHRYYTPSIQGPFRISSFSSTYLTMNRKFFNKKLDGSLSLMDIFKQETSTVVSRYADQHNAFWDYQDSRKINITVRYHFGNQKLKGTKAVTTTDEQNRI